MDGFVVPVPKVKLEAYRAMSVRCGEIWREHGALEFRETVADWMHDFMKPENMPFDGKRMIWGSFNMIVDM